ncbi:MAG: LysM peptidoglycan-binding domain-containing protein [Candidatus Methylomirabilales bacterium]
MQWRRAIPLSALLILCVLTPLEAQAPGSLPGTGSEASVPVEALHQVQSSDNLHLLAAYYYGDARQWVRILETNRPAIQNPSVIHPGQILRIFLSPDWTPPEPYAKWKHRVREEGPPATLTPSKAPEQSSSLPTPEGAFSLRYHGRKGLVERAEVTIDGNILLRQGEQTQEKSFALAGLLESRINDVTPEGYFDITGRTVDLASQGTPADAKALDPTTFGLPPKGQGFRWLVDDRLQLVKVLDGNPQLVAALHNVTYPERALRIGDGWETTQTVRTVFPSPLLVKIAYVLKGQERFQEQDVLRLDLESQGELKIPERQVAITLQGSGFVFISRATGSLLYQETQEVTTIDNGATGASQTVTTTSKLTNRL